MTTVETSMGGEKRQTARQSETARDRQRERERETERG